MKEFISFFSINYNHPLAKPDDPFRRISIKERWSYLNWISLSMGIVFFLSGTFFLIVFGYRSDFKSLVFKGDSKTLGTVINIAPTDCAENDVRIFEYTYQIKVDGVKYVGISYDILGEIKKYSFVEVEYEKSDPESSRIIGMRMKEYSFFISLFILIFPCVGFGLIYLTFCYANTELCFVRNGIVSKGQILNISEVQPKDKESDVYYDAFVEFETIKGDIIKTKIQESDLNKIKGVNVTKILYLPWDPN